MSDNGNNNVQNPNGNCKFIRAVEEAFFLLDGDHNRLIGSDDFCTIAKSIGIELDSTEALSLIRTAIREQTDDHTDETGLSVDHYSGLMLRYVGSEELNDELRHTFDAFDRDHDGWITREDMDKLRNESIFFDHLDDEQYELVVKELFIQSNNNRIDFNQFVNLMMHQ